MPVCWLCEIPLVYGAAALIERTSRKERWFRIAPLDPRRQLVSLLHGTPHQALTAEDRLCGIRDVRRTPRIDKIRRPKAARISSTMGSTITCDVCSDANQELRLRRGVAQPCQAFRASQLKASYGGSSGRFRGDRRHSEIGGDRGRSGTSGEIGGEIGRSGEIGDTQLTPKSCPINLH